MYVRLLSGRYAGEERDIRPDAARVMLADGRAVLPSMFEAHVLRPPALELERGLLEGQSSKSTVGLFAAKRKKA